MNLPAYRKAIAAAAGAAVTVITQLFPHATWEAPAVAILSAIAVHLIPNSPTPPKGQS